MSRIRHMLSQHAVVPRFIEILLSSYKRRNTELTNVLHIVVIVIVVAGTELLFYSSNFATISLMKNATVLYVQK